MRLFLIILTSLVISLSCMVQAHAAKASWYGGKLYHSQFGMKLY